MSNTARRRIRSSVVSYDRVSCITLTHSSTSDPDSTSEELLEHWFGPDTQSEWFPYPDTAVSYYLTRKHMIS